MIGAEDPYRFAGPGIPSLSTSPDAIAYFSIVDGGRTNLAPFNQNPLLDHADWQFTTCNPPLLLVQSGFCPGMTVDMTRDLPEAT